MTLETAGRNLGKAVLYLPSRRLEGRTEVGTISAVSDTFVFVRYGKNEHSAATRPEDLEPHAPVREIVFAEEVVGNPGAYLVSLECGHKMGTRQQKLPAYACRECGAFAP
jgi:hypothetical protein